MRAKMKKLGLFTRACLLVGGSMISLGFGSCQNTGNQVQGSVTNGVDPTPTSFNMTIPFDAGTDASYTFSNSSVTELASGVLRLKTINQSDSDDSAVGFGGGTFSGTQWDATNNLLRLSTATNTSELDSSWTPEYSHLIDYWKLNETAGASSASDSINVLNSATPQAGVTFGGAGQLQQSAALSGTNNGYLLIPATNLGNAFSIAAWCYVTPGSVNIQTLIANTTAANSSAGFKILVDSYNTTNHAVLFESGNGGSGSDVPTALNVFSFGTWNHVVVVVDRTALTVSIYVNGQNLISNATINTFPDTAALRIGQMTDTDYPWHGSVDDVAFWNTKLTAAEVATIYSRQSAKFSGTFTSRVIQGYDTSDPWSSLSATTTLPFYKELASAAETSTSYSSLGSNLSSGVVGLWHLDEASGATSVVDASSYADNGTPANVSFGQAAVLSTGASFNGTNSQITIPFSASYALVPSALTASAWFYTNDLTAHQIILSNAVPNGYELNINGTGCPASTLCFLMTVNNVTYPVSYATSNLAANHWYHVVGTYDGSSVRMYLNGTAVGTPSSTPNVVIGYTTNPLCIGSKPMSTACGANQFFTGQVDELALWNRALSATEVTLLYRRAGNRLKYQVRSCTTSNCADQSSLVGGGWIGPDGTFLSYFSELQNNTSVDATGAPTGQVLASAMNLSFAGVAVNKYVQYRAILESDDSGGLCSYGNCSPELKATGLGPNHYLAGEVSVISNSNLGSTFKKLTPGSFTVTGELCSPGIHYALSGDGSSFFYWNGSAWATSSNYSTGNTSVDINANLASFPTGGTLQIKTYLETNGVTPCQVDALSISGTN